MYLLRTIVFITLFLVRVVCAVTDSFMGYNGRPVKPIRTHVYKKLAHINPDPQNTPFNQAKAEADYILKDFAQKVPTKALKKVAQYISYYKSWYQSVAPAPRALQKSMTPGELALVADIKRIAQAFVTDRTPGRVGASRLSPEGVDFYEYVLQRLRDLQKFMSMPPLESFYR